MNLLFRNGKKINQADGTSDTSKADKTNLSTISATGSTNNTGSTIKAGTYFYLDGVLKRAKTDISNDASFTASNMESGDNSLNLGVVDVSSKITPTTGTTISSAKKSGNIVEIVGVTPKITTGNALVELFTVTSDLKPVGIFVGGSIIPAGSSDFGYGVINMNNSQGKGYCQYNKTTTYGLYFNIIYMV